MDAASWIVLAFFFLIFDAELQTYTIFWAGLGSIVAAVSAVFGASLGFQIGIAAITTLSSATVLRKTLMNWILPQDIPNMIDTHFIGLTAIVHNEEGRQVKIGDEIWVTDSDLTGKLGQTLTVTGKTQNIVHTKEN